MICPNCQNEVLASEHWDFFDCTHCKASLQLEEGKVKLLKAPDNSEEGLAPAAQEENPENPEEPLEEAGLENIDEVQNEEPPVVDEISYEEPHQENAGAEEQEELSQTSPKEQEASAKDEFDKNEGLSEVAHFGNTPVQDNNFIYKLNVSEIKDEETLLEVKKALKSPRLKIDASKAIKRLSKDSFQIQNLHAVQASYLARKLSLLSVKISWSQKAPLLE